MARILLVEDEESTRLFLAQSLSEEGYELLEATSCAEAAQALRSQPVDLVILDLKLPDGSGLELLPEVIARDPGLPVVILTGEGGIPEAVQAMKLRACDFFRKPPSLSALKETVAQLLRKVAMQKEIQRLAEEATADGELPFIVGQSRRMQRVMQAVERVAHTNVTVLLTGESGTGKERIARLIHEKSRRKQKRFVAVNCGAIAEQLVETELFGSAKGGYTGATERPGLIERADGGTLFLDEISTMKPELQAKLLRFLEDGKVRRVGSTEEIPVDVRIVAASNENLPKLIESGRFRQDLYYRLARVSIHLPPLRERKEDLPLLVAAIIDHCNRKQLSSGEPIRGLTAEAFACLEAYDWPGNIRELLNVLMSAAIMANGPYIDIADLPAPLSLATALKATAAPRVPDEASAIASGSLLAWERRCIAEALQKASGDLQVAARLLGMSVEELRKRLD
jgi:two-component system response regulator PilR (NtrC family)